MRVLIASFLAFLMLQASVVRDLHILLESHDNEQVCLIAGAEQHFHSEEFAHANCQICLFHISLASFEPNIFPQLSRHHFKVVTIFYHQNPISQVADWVFYLRGPPMAEIG